MEFIKDIIYVNKMTGKKAMDLFLKNWLIIFTGLIYTTINIVAYIVASPFLFIPLLNIVAGIALYFLSVGLISSYLYILYSIIKYKKFEIKDIKRGFKVYFYEVSRVLFIGYIAGILAFRLVVPVLASSIGGYLDTATIINIIMIIVLVVINPLPEVIYQKGHTGLDGIRYTFEYTKENWIEWLIPNAVLVGLLYIITGNTVTNLFSTGISVGSNLLSLKGIGLYLIGQIIFSFTMIYRGVLFDMLSTSTRRKRMFMRNTYK